MKHIFYIFYISRKQFSNESKYPFEYAFFKKTEVLIFFII